MPFKLKDKVYAEYREVCDALYGAYEARENKARMSNFRERVSEPKDGGHKLDRERDKLLRAYESRKAELKTIENNMGFFNVKSLCRQLDGKRDGKQDQASERRYGSD